MGIAIGESATQAVRHAGPSRLTSIIGGSAGNVIEWFDFLAYSVFSIYFSKAFFPGGDMTAQLLNTAAIAAVGYVVRPLGSWLIGVVADRHGRRIALSGAVAMMSLGSFMIAVTPTYATIGIARTDRPGDRAAAPGVQHGRRGRDQCDLSGGNGAAGAPRVLRRLRPGDGGDRAAAGAMPAAPAAMCRV